jgi:hypothetical protein
MRGHLAHGTLGLRSACRSYRRIHLRVGYVQGIHAASFIILYHVYFFHGPSHVYPMFFCPQTAQLVSGPGVGTKVSAATSKSVAVWTDNEFAAAMGLSAGGRTQSRAQGSSDSGGQGQGKLGGISLHPIGL